MNKEIESIKQVINFALAAGAFKTIENAASAINAVHALEQKANALQGEHDQAVKLLEEANNTIEEMKSAPKLVAKK